jgi:hypothetical protein
MTSGSSIQAMIRTAPATPHRGHTPAFDGTLPTETGRGTLAGAGARNPQSAGATSSIQPPPIAL